VAADVIQCRQHLFLGSRLKRLAEQMQSDVSLVAQRAGLAIQPGQYPLLAGTRMDRKRSESSRGA
jgi:hypothetical protein